MAEPYPTALDEGSEDEGLNEDDTVCSKKDPNAGEAVRDPPAEEGKEEKGKACGGAKYADGKWGAREFQDEPALCRPLDPCPKDGYGLAQEQDTKTWVE